jgi:hypothetical protein
MNQDEYEKTMRHLRLAKVGLAIAAVGILMMIAAQIIELLG